MVSYDKLWHRLLDLKMKKGTLCYITGISSSTMAKMGKNGVVSLEVLEKICVALNCDIGDIVCFKNYMKEEQRDE